MKKFREDWLGLILYAAFSVTLVALAINTPRPTTNEDIKTMLLETQRNQAQLAAMLLYTEDNLKTEIKRLERKPPLLPEVR